MSDRLQFNAILAIYQLYHVENKLNTMRWLWCLFFRNNMLNWIFYSSSSLKQQSMGKKCHSTWDTLFWFRAKQSLLLALKDTCWAEKQQITNLIVIELTWPGLKPTIYCTWGEHFNHYTTDEVTRQMRLPGSFMLLWLIIVILL